MTDCCLRTGRRSFTGVRDMTKERYWTGRRVSTVGYQANKTMVPPDSVQNGWQDFGIVNCDTDKKQENNRSIPWITHALEI